MKFGILLTAYACDDTLKKCLSPWLKSEYPISVVSVPFEEYKDMSQDNSKTKDILSLHKERFSNVFFEPEYIKESDARNLALSDLAKYDLDYIWLVDGDEWYTETQIKKIATFVENQEDLAWFAIPLKNYVFDENTWVDGFCPPRIFRKQYSNTILKEFYWDNDVKYQRDDNVLFDYKNLPKGIIPKALAHVKHITWLSNSRSRKKVEYQRKHFGGKCSYRWNNELEKLEFDQDYFNQINQPIPQLNYDK